MTLRKDYKLERYAKAVAMLAEGTSVTAVAESLGVSRTTLYGWRQDPMFRQLHRNVCDGAVHFARAELRQMTLEAVKALRDCLKDDQAEADLERNKLRSRAALTVLRIIGAFDAESPLDEMDDEEMQEGLAALGYKRVDDGEAVH